MTNDAMPAKTFGGHFFPQSGYCFVFLQKTSILERPIGV